MFCAKTLAPDSIRNMPICDQQLAVVVAAGVVALEMVLTIGQALSEVVLQRQPACIPRQLPALRVHW